MKVFLMMVVALSMVWGCDTGDGASEVNPDVGLDMVEADGADGADVSVPDTCSSTCATRMAVAEDQGFCVESPGLDEATCLAYCADGTTWDDAASAAFEHCATTDPLCFQTLDGCMLAALFGDDPEASHPQRLTLSGAGFVDAAGKTLKVDIRKDTSDAVIVPDTLIEEDGSFRVEISIDESVPFYAFSVSAFVDVNDNGVCDPEAQDNPDLAFRGELQPRFGTDPLEFELTWTPDDVAEDFLWTGICGRF